MRISVARVSVVATCTTIWVAAGCGDDAANDGGQAAATALPPSESKLSEMSDGQAAAFCADLASTQGGYGNRTRMLTCGQATVTLSFDLGANPAECKTTFRQLPAACSSLTTGQIKSCVQDIAAATCERRDAPSCDPFLACAGGGS